MKYMVMMFGSAAEMMEVRSPEWLKEMIGFMVAIDEELRATGELVQAEGLADGSAAKVVRSAGGEVVVTDGPYNTTDAPLVGYWVLDVADEARLVEIATRIVKYSGQVELRPIADGPPPID